MWFCHRHQVFIILSCELLWFALLQELGIPFTCIGISEKDPAYRSFVTNNFPDVKHVHETLQEQSCGAACLLHRVSGDSFSGCACGPDQPPQLAVLGTPCDPYSRQRPKRFISGSVKTHKDYGTTFSDTYDFLRQHEPKICVMEQVPGFNMPFSSDDDETPKDRLAVGEIGVCCVHGFLRMRSNTSNCWIRLKR